MMFISNAYAEAARRRQSAESWIFCRSRWWRCFIFWYCARKQARQGSKAMIERCSAAMKCYSGGEVGVNKVYEQLSEWNLP